MLTSILDCMLIVTELKNKCFNLFVCQSGVLSFFGVQPLSGITHFSRNVSVTFTFVISN